METETGFNLEQAIENWRDELSAEPGITDDNLRELESHLRETIAKDLERGSTQQNAFETGLNRLGAREQIAPEHAKENFGLIWQQRVFWMAFAAMVFPALLSLPSLSLLLATHWLQNAGYSFAGDLDQALSGPSSFMVGLGLVIGIMVVLGRKNRVNLRSIVKRGTQKPMRLFLLVAIPIVLYLAIYVWTDLAYYRYALWRWTKYVLLGFAVLVAFAAMPNRWGMYLQHGIDWLVASRVRLGGLLLLLISPEMFNLFSFITHEQSNEGNQLMAYFAGYQTSAVTLKLLLLACAIALQQTIVTKKTGEAPDRLTRGASQVVVSRLWRHRALWMCAGALLLFGWSVINLGFHELIAGGVEQIWIRVGAGLAIPLAVAGVFQIGRWKNAVLRQTESAFGNNGAILSMALLFALLNSAGIWLRMNAMVDVSGSQSVYVSDMMFTTILFELLWPAAMLCLLLWMKWQNGDEAVSGQLKQR